MRARWLKPEFFTDKKVAEAGPIAALVYQALWCMADDGGTAPCDPDTIKAQMFYRWSAVGVPDISGALQVLSDMRRIARYEVGDDSYARILTWKKHQQVHKPSKFRYPKESQEHTSDGAAPVRHSPGTGESAVPASPHPRLLDTQTPKERDIESDARFDRAWSLYPRRAGGNSRTLALKAWTARVRSGVSPDDMLAGVERYAAFVRATGKEGTEFVKQAASFFGPAAHWTESWEIPVPPPARAGATSLSVAGERPSIGARAFATAHDAIKDL